MISLAMAYETYRKPITADDPHFVEGCVPDVHVADLADITPEKLANLGVGHALIDRDGTIACWPQPPISEDDLAHLQGIAATPELRTFSIATDNMSRQVLEEARSISDSVRVFQPVDDGETRTPVYKSDPDFYTTILEELDASGSPDRVVMIGDSPYFDILPAQRLGMRTILVDRLERRFSIEGARALMEARRAEADKA